ncbi:PAS/PAC sensor hybrid histidine kinase [Pelobacter propionicus DSM 2379]|uniref:histidine kinase n=2 Tax=Pelobacter propionicus TaxID=29543 RepID=A1AS95_PELPD|nr:PAS/PAC sensor hybrid histidine kinase [Pelobacter propionicus DSM 2379]
MRKQPPGYIPHMDDKLSAALLHSIKGIAWECDPLTLRFSHVDQEAESILGYPCRQWVEEQDFWQAHIPTDDAEQCAIQLREAAEKGESREFEHRMAAADGRTVWFRTIVTPLPTEGGSIRLQGVMIDISESRQTRMLLQSSEERFQRAMLGANDGIWDWNLLTDEVYFSPRWKEMLGYAEHELENNLDSWSYLTHPADLQATLTLIKDYVEGRSDTFEAEFRMRHRDGHYICVLSRGLLARDDDGRGTRLVGTHVDITRQRRAEEELYLARYCLDQAPMGIFRLDQDMNVLYANRHACESLGYSREELCRMSVFDFDPQFRREDLPNHLKKRQQRHCMTFEAVHRNRDGVIFPVEITSTHLEYQGEEFLFSFARDITERKRAEQALKEQEELYSVIFNQAPDGVVLVDAETLEFREFNDTACAGLGYSREEFARLSVADINPEYDKEWHRSHINEIISRNYGVFETIHRHRNGSLRNMRISVRTVQIRGCRYLLSFWTDTTEQARLQEELRLREYYQRALLDNFPSAAWIKDREGRFLAVNRQLATFLGLASPQELVDKTIHDVAPSALADQNTAEDRRVLTSGRPKHDEEELPVSGENRWFEVYISPVSIDGQVVGTVGCNWDVTERKKIEQNLRESEERYRRLVELSPDAIFIHSGNRFVFMNQAAARLLGAKTPEELYGRKPLDFIHPDQREMVGQRIDRALERRDNPPIEELMVRLDGSTVPVEMVSVHHTYRGKDAVLAIARDISERMKIQDERVRSQKLESLGLLAGGIAHDFNNILSGILGNISLVCSRLDPDDPLASRLKSCEKATIRATGLTRQLLTFARGGEPVRKVIDPAPLIRESATFVLRGTNVKGDIRMTEGLSCINVDAGQISQVLNNLIINATHSMPGGGVIIISAMNEALHEGNAFNLAPGDYLRITVQDQGCGIPPENLPKIFDPYFTTKRRGSGLGLASAYAIIRRHGGAIEVSSRVGVGTTFTLRLPAQPQVHAADRMVGPGNVLCGSGRILVMDDEEIIREVSREILQCAGYCVESCSDGREALQRFQEAKEKSRPFDAIIMDLTIPGGMGGKEAAQLIRAVDPNAVLIVSSGYSNDPVIATYQQHGFNGSVVKPFSFQSLAGEVQRLINKGK